MHVPLLVQGLLSMSAHSDEALQQNGFGTSWHRPRTQALSSHTWVTGSGSGQVAALAHSRQPATAAWTQPLAGLHESSVHAFASSQTIAVWLHV
jgi:hypothetical protein